MVGNPQRQYVDTDASESMVRGLLITYYEENAVLLDTTFFFYPSKFKSLFLAMSNRWEGGWFTCCYSTDRQRERLRDGERKRQGWGGYLIFIEYAWSFDERRLNNAFITSDIQPFDHQVPEWCDFLTFTVASIVASTHYDFRARCDVFARRLPMVLNSLIRVNQS